MDRNWRLKDGTRWRTFMRLLRLDDLMTSYTKARPGGGLGLVDVGLDLELGTASGSSTHGSALCRCSAPGIPARWLPARGIPTAGGPVNAVLKRLLLCTALVDGSFHVGLCAALPTGLRASGRRNAMSNRSSLPLGYGSFTAYSLNGVGSFPLLAPLR